MSGEPKFKVGQRVLYRGTWGAAAPKRGVIVGNDGEKNGQRVYGVDLDNGDAKWGYEDQFEEDKS